MVKLGKRRLKALKNKTPEERAKINSLLGVKETLKEPGEETSCSGWIYIIPPKEGIPAALEEIVFANENRSGAHTVYGPDAKLVSSHCGDDGIYNPPEGESDVNGLKPGRKAITLGFGVLKGRVTHRFPYDFWVHKLRRSTCVYIGCAVYSANPEFHPPNNINLLKD